MEGYIMKKFIVISMLIIAGSTQHASSMSKLQQGLDGIENRCKNLIPTLAHSQGWAKFCHWLEKKAIQVYKVCPSYFQEKPLREELLKGLRKNRFSISNLVLLGYYNVPL